MIFKGKGQAGQYVGGSVCGTDSSVLADVGLIKECVWNVRLL